MMNFAQKNLAYSRHIRFKGYDKTSVGTDLQLNGCTEEDAINYRIYGSGDGVGDLVTNTKDEHYGKYRIEFAATGKNLFDVYRIPSYDNQGNGYYINNEDGTFTIKTPKGSPSLGVASYYTLGDLAPYMKAGQLVRYNASSTNNENNIYMINIGLYWWSGLSGVVPEGMTSSNIAFYSGSPAGINTFTNVQFELGSKFTGFEPYRESVLKIYLDKPLYEGEYIDYQKQKAVYTDKEEHLELAPLKLGRGINNIFVKTNIAPSKVEMRYYVEKEE